MKGTNNAGGKSPPSLFGKYKQSVQTLKPFRWTSAQSVNFTQRCFIVKSHKPIANMRSVWLLTSSPHPMDNAGFVSYATFSWLTSILWGLFRKRLDISTLHLSPLDEASGSSDRSRAAICDLCVCVCVN